MSIASGSRVSRADIRLKAISRRRLIHKSKD
jgi:hypothetical protein